MQGDGACSKIGQSVIEYFLKHDTEHKTSKISKTFNYLTFLEYFNSDKFKETIKNIRLEELKELRDGFQSWIKVVGNTIQFNDYLMPMVKTYTKKHNID